MKEKKTKAVNKTKKTVKKLISNKPKKDEYNGTSTDLLFQLQEGTIAHYQTLIGQRVKEHAEELVDSLIQGALDGDIRIALELVKTYMPEKVVVGVKELRADTMKDINYAANKILDAKAKGKMDATLADDLMKNLMDRMNFIMADEMETNIEMIASKK